MAVLLPSDPALDRLPDPIPASYYARPAPAARTVPSPPGLPGAEPPARGLRGWPARALAAVACLLGVAWAVQLPWRPLLGLLGLLTIAAALLVADVGGVRRMVPLLRSPDPRRLRAGWAAVGGLLLLTGALALAVPGQLPLTGQRASHGSAGARTGGPAATAPSPAVPAPVAATPLPTSSPSPTASPPASGVTFLNAPLAAQRGQTVVLRVRATPDTRCSTTLGYPNAPDLAPARSDGAGNVSWTWHVSRHAPTGSWSIRTTCGGAVGLSLLTVG